MKKVYTVKGNHDGNIGVFSNFKAAYNCAVEYATRHDNQKVQAYAAAAKEMKETEIVTIGADWQSASAEIEMFFLQAEF